MISFIIPAYNEEELLPRTLASLFQAAGKLGEPFEVLVVDDGSTDGTARIARSRGARVVSVKLRHIAATRNAGAREATGDVLVFVDADTQVGEATLRGVLEALRDGAVGGGARVKFDHVPLPARLLMKIFIFIYHGLGLAAGCFIFARRETFESVGGFDEHYFASEEIHLTWALRREGRFVLIREPVLSSGRKARMYTATQIILVMLGLLFRGPGAVRKRKGLEMWYDGRREK